MTLIPNLPTLDIMNFDIQAILDQAIEAAIALQRSFIERAIPVEKVGQIRGPVHAASLQVWNEVARLAGVPFVSAEIIAEIPIDLFSGSNPAETDPATLAPLQAAREYAEAGGFWRTDLCSSTWIKSQIAETGHFETEPSFNIDDPRIIDLHYGLPSVRVLARPILTPVRIGDWPVEFRVFFGGKAEEDGAVSFYYPQAGEFSITDELLAAAEMARDYGSKLYAKRKELGLTPWLITSEPTDAIGASVDFMLSEEVGLVMIDAGPGYGYGAHPCCFIDSPIKGIKWQLSEGVTLR